MNTNIVPLCLCSNFSPPVSDRNRKPSVRLSDRGLKQRYHLWLPCSREYGLMELRDSGAITGASRPVPYYASMQFRRLLQGVIHVGIPLLRFTRPKALCAGQCSATLSFSSQWCDSSMVLILCQPYVLFYLFFFRCARYDSAWANNSRALSRSTSVTLAPPISRDSSSSRPIRSKRSTLV